MKKFIFISILIFLSSTVHAGRLMKGIVNQINLESGYLVINNTRFQIIHGKTKLMLGKQRLDLGQLEKGNRISFKLNNTLITEIRLNTSYQLKE